MCCHLLPFYFNKCKGNTGNCLADMDSSCIQQWLQIIWLYVLPLMPITGAEPSASTVLGFSESSLGCKIVTGVKYIFQEKIFPSCIVTWIQLPLLCLWKEVQGIGKHMEKVPNLMSSLSHHFLEFWGPGFWIPTKCILCRPKTDWPCQDLTQESTREQPSVQPCLLLALWSVLIGFWV